MNYKIISPTNLRQNIYQYTKDANNGVTFKIENKNKKYNAILISDNEYKHLKAMEITLQTNANDLRYKKLHLLDEIKNDETFYRIAENIIINIWKQNITINQDPMWPMTTELLACLSCYVLRASQKTLNKLNLETLSQKSFTDLTNLAKKQGFHNNSEQESYFNVINHCINTLTNLASSQNTQKDSLQIYRLSL